MSESRNLVLKRFFHSISHHPRIISTSCFHLFRLFSFFPFFLFPDLPSLLSITLQANSLPKLADFTLSSLPLLQTLSIQSNCASQLSPNSIAQDPERWRRESAFLNKHFVLSGRYTMSESLEADLPQLIRVDIDPYSFIDTVVFEVKSM